MNEIPSKNPRINIAFKKWPRNKQVLAAWALLAGLTAAALFPIAWLVYDTEVQSQLIYFGQDGKLQYTPYTNEGESQAVNVVPDFSFAGYMKGGQSLPSVPEVHRISSIPGDNRAHVQDAINNVSSRVPDLNGIRGALVLESGLYLVNGSLVINASGVVLRGEGQGTGGTVLKATANYQHDFLLVQGSLPGSREIDSTRRLITDSYVPTGSKSIVVNSTAGYTIGERILVVSTVNQLWIDTLDMAQYGWTTSGYQIPHERTILAINGNTITVDIPFVNSIQALYGGGYMAKANVTGRLQRCGVENIRFDSSYTSSTDEAHGWAAVVLSWTENCWVQGVTTEHFSYSCVVIRNHAAFNTIQDCAMLAPISQITGSRRYAFNIDDGLGNLFQRCYSSEGRHCFVTGSRVTGPNVWLDCLAENTHADIGPHHRWATGVLFDNIMGGSIRVQNRKDSGTGHGWAGAQVMFWNSISTKDDMKVESPPIARNWGVGCTAYEFTGAGYWEHQYRQVTPRSLYLQQLQDRLGAAAIANITIPAQRQGEIYSLLASWGGNGAFSSTAASAADTTGLQILEFLVLEYFGIGNAAVLTGLLVIRLGKCIGDKTKLRKSKILPSASRTSA